MDLLDELGTRVVCGDGAMGTLLLNDGIPFERCLEELCVSEPEQIQKVHEDYVAAGARVIETNTFGANAIRLAHFGMENRVAEINRAAVKLAKAATRNKDVWVAGSVGPLGISQEEATARRIDRASCFREQITALADAGVDLILFETFGDLDEMEIAFRAKTEVSDMLEICAFACAPDGKLRCNVSLGEAFGRLRNLGARIMGINCLNDPRNMIALLRHVPPGYVLAVYPTAGTPETRDGRLHFDVAPARFAEDAGELVARGTRLLGGCCGTTPAHIAALARVIAQQ